jgi:hypothetical protein
VTSLATRQQRSPVDIFLSNDSRAGVDRRRKDPVAQIESELDYGIGFLNIGLLVDFRSDRPCLDHPQNFRRELEASHKNPCSSEIPLNRPTGTLSISLACT